MTDKLKDCERQKCEIWTRVSGYLRPKSYFNAGKKSEYDQRVCYSEEVALKRADTYVHP